MAYAALVSLSQTISKLLRDQDQYPLCPHEKQQTISIHEQIILFQAFLEDYVEKASILEGRIMDVANEAEDIIEYFMWKHMQRRNCTLKSTTGSASTTEVSHLGGMPFDQWQYFTSESIAGPKGTSEVSHQSDMCLGFKNLEKVVEEIESIAGEMMEIKESARIEDVKLSDSSFVSTSSSRLIIRSTDGKLDIAMVGFEDELMAMKGRLCGEPSKLQVIPIFGMGGIGKTTFARKAYDDQLTIEHFQIRAWVTVSQDYSALQVLSNLLVSIGGGRSKEGDESKIAENVYKSLKGKRYLIVVDDIWSTNAWDDVRRIFPNDNNGSRIIVTTRLSDVATYPNLCSPIQEMHFLDLDQSWNLLRNKVFPQGNCPSELENIGKTIAKNCRGLPLAIVVVAGLLSMVSQTRVSWENIAKNINEAVGTRDEQFAEIVLSSSYNHLPHHLRPCFLYLGGFPEDYEIRASKLVKLWVAEGFLKLADGCKSCEEVAEEYLEDLVKRSLVLVNRRKSSGKIKTCSVHDLVRDLCIRKSQQEKFLVRIKDIMTLQESIRNQRRVSIAHSADLNYVKDICDSHIHTIICTDGCGYKFHGWMWHSLRNLRLLRVFDMADDRVGFLSLSRLPPEIEIFHLRYLALSYLVKIPATISNLENLQTLIIYPESKSRSVSYVERSYLCRQVQPILLPSEVWRMKQLRHLISCYFHGLPNPEATSFPLENLRTISEVKNFKCTVRILQIIPNLKKLGISYYEDEYIGDIELKNLQYLQQLEKLTLEVKGRLPGEKQYDTTIYNRIKIVFPTTLKKLTLSGGKQRSWEDMGIIGTLPNLEVLKLRDYACCGDKWETSEEEFRQLKFLLISGSELQHWIIESSHFPNLKCLVLHFCHHLEMIPDEIGEIPTLEMIEVDDTNESLVGSAKRIQEEQQQYWGNDALQIHCVKSRAHEGEKFEAGLNLLRIRQVQSSVLRRKLAVHETREET